MPFIPEWIKTSGDILVVGLFITGLIVAIILEYRYTSPYTLLKSSSGEKQNRAAILSFWQTLPFFFLFISIIIINSKDNQHIKTLMFICGLWAFLFGLNVVGCKRKFDNRLRFYKNLDLKIKNGTYKHSFTYSLTNRFSFLLPSEIKIFLDEGYSEQELNSVQ